MPASGVKSPAQFRKAKINNMTAPKLKDAAEKPLSSEPKYCFAVPREALLAIQLFQSTDETRSAIVATCFELVVNRLVMVATDGRRLGTYDTVVLSDSLLSGELPDDDRFSIDLTGAKKLPKVKGAEGHAITVAVFDKHVELSCGKYTYRAPKIEEKFPEWRQILPTTKGEATSEIAISAKLLSSFGKAAKLLTDSEVLRLGFHGKGGAITVGFEADREFTGILMPCRMDDDEKKPDEPATT